MRCRILFFYGYVCWPLCVKGMQVTEQCKVARQTILDFIFIIFHFLPWMKWLELSINWIFSFNFNLKYYLFIFILLTQSNDFWLNIFIVYIITNNWDIVNSNCNQNHGIAGLPSNLQVQICSITRAFGRSIPVAHHESND